MSASSDDRLPPPSPTNPDKVTVACHCGRVKVEMPSPPKMVNECRCSICYRYGALWTYLNPDDVLITAEAPGLKTYVRVDSDGDLGFNFCGNCGCMTHWSATELGNLHRPADKAPMMGVNCRMLPPRILEGVEKRSGHVGEY